MNFLRFLRHRWTPHRPPISASPSSSAAHSTANAITQDGDMQTLRLLALPYACTPKHGIQYLLYPVTLQKKNASLVRRGVEDVLGLWRNGLWVIGRMYRTAWNILFLPRVYQDHRGFPSPTPPSSSSSTTTTTTTLKKRVFDLSDVLVQRWSTSAEEELLRQVNTHAQFVHFGKNADIPIRKLDILYPAQIAKALPIPVQSPYDQQRFLPSSKKQPNSQSVDFEARLKQHLSYFGQLASPHYSRLLFRSKAILLITTPLYAVMPTALAQLDLLLADAHIFMLGDNPHLFGDLSPFVSLPLAYNLIRWFSYSRCYRTASFLRDFLHAQQSVFRPALEAEKQRLLQMVATEQQKPPEQCNRNQVELYQQHIDKLQASLDAMGVSIQEDPQLTTLVQPYFEYVDTQVDSSASFTGAFLDKRSLVQIARAYGIHPPDLIRDMTKAVDRLRTQARIEAIAATSATKESEQGSKKDLHKVAL